MHPWGLVMVWHKAMTDNDWANELLNQSICFTPFTRGQVGRNNMKDWGGGEGCIKEKWEKASC